MKIHTVEDLIEAYVHENLNSETNKLVLDNDQIVVYKDGKRVFETNPHDLLRDLLDDAGLPWEDS
ncbi:MAG TPA: hypothetical protein VIY48_05320 [Candidatus Paceibacterota bacterium]